MFIDAGDVSVLSGAIPNERVRYTKYPYTGMRRYPNCGVLPTPPYGHQVDLQLRAINNSRQISTKAIDNNTMSRI
jgi:hypothetical protein